MMVNKLWLSWFRTAIAIILLQKPVLHSVLVSLDINDYWEQFTQNVEMFASYFRFGVLLAIYSTAVNCKEALK